MRDPVVAPADFMSYVERRLVPLEVANLRLTGDDTQAERLAREMLTLVAVRWRRLNRADGQHSRPAGQSADLYLGRLYKQEADELSFPQTELNLNVAGTLRRRPGRTVLRASDEAELIWEESRRSVRRRQVLIGAAAGVVALIAICQSRGGDPENETLLPEETAGPEVVGLPDGAELAGEPIGSRKVLDLPLQLTVPSLDTAPVLSGNKIRRAVALAASSRADTSPIYVLGEDGDWRRVDSAPELAGLWLQASSLSPDGIWIAFGTPGSATVVNVTTGSVKEYSFSSPDTHPVWLGPRHLLVAEDGLVDVQDGSIINFPTTSEDVVTPRYAAGQATDPTRLLELLSVGQPATAPARLRRWALDPARGPQQVVIPLTGPLTGLVGSWRGPAFGLGTEPELVVRASNPSPTAAARNAGTVVVVVRPANAKVERALLVNHEELGAARVIGWADSRTVLLSLTKPSQQQIVGWDLLSGGLTRACEANTDGVVSLPELTRIA